MDTFKLVNLVKSDQESILSNETSLSICLQANGFSFSLIDKYYKLRAVGDFETDLTGGITSVMNNIKACFNSIGIRSFSFADARIICQTNKNVWVPFKLYDSSKVKDYIRAAVHVNASDTIISNISEKIEAVSIFAIPMHLNTGIKILMPKAKFLCQHQVMSEYGFDVSTFAKNTILLYKRDNACDLVAFRGTDFIFSNSFDYNNENDLLYYILFTLQQLAIDPEEVNFLLTGYDYTTEEKKIIREHIKNVVYANPMENIKVGVDFDGTSLQKYFLTLTK